MDTLSIDQLKNTFSNLTFSEKNGYVYVHLLENEILSGKIELLSESLLKQLNDSFKIIDELAPLLKVYPFFMIGLELIEGTIIQYKITNIYNEYEYIFGELNEKIFKDVIKDYFDEIKAAILKEFNEQTEGKTSTLNILAQNEKMKISSGEGVVIYNFGLPAFKSKDGTKICPNATKCVGGCYAKQGTYLWRPTQEAYEKRLSIVKNPLFQEIIKNEIYSILDKNEDKIVMIRVHDSGDFYSKEYQEMWYQIAEDLIDFPNLVLYAYTKMISQSKALEKMQPSNFDLIYSFGGSEDHLIDVESDKHSKVFESEEELIKNGYINGTDDDKNAVIGPKKIGLVYHGGKSYKNTSWKGN